MFQLIKTQSIISSNKNNKQIKQLFFTSVLTKPIKIFFIDKIFILPINVKITKLNKKTYFINQAQLSILNLDMIPTILLYKKKNLLILISTLLNKKRILNLYHQLIKLNLRGILHKFKLNLFLKGIGFKILVQQSNLVMKLGFSHEIKLKIPNNVLIINRTNKLIFTSSNYQFLTQYVSFIQHFKRPEPYKGKGLLLNNQKIHLKEGKTGKK